MTTAKYVKDTINNKITHYIETDPHAVRVQDLGGGVLASSSLFGINGTFFDVNSGTVLGIATGKNGVEVRHNGEHTGGGYSRGTLIAYRPPGTNSQVIKRFVIKHISEAGIPLNCIDWAIGGLSLHLGDTTLNIESSLTKKIVSAEHAQSVNGVYPAYRSDRTAIGYKNNKVILAIIKEATPWECRKVMKTLRCNDAIMLDGSTCSQMRAKSAGSIVNIGVGRKIYSCITVDPDVTWQ